MADKLQNVGLSWLFFSFKGRIARQSFALSVVFLLIMLGLVVYQIVLASDDGSLLAFWGLVFMALSIALLWSILALSVKRLNDLGRPPIALVAFFIPMVNWVFILYLMFAPSIDETNEHGAPPFWTSK